MIEPIFTLPTITAEQAISRARSGALEMIDLRKPEAVRASGIRLNGAAARHPFQFGHDDPLTRSTGEIAVFCVHGHEVSHFACALLRLHDANAVLVEGGIEALLAAGAPTTPAEQEN